MDATGPLPSVVMPRLTLTFDADAVLYLDDAVAGEIEDDEAGLDGLKARLPGPLVDDAERPPVIAGLPIEGQVDLVVLARDVMFVEDCQLVTHLLARSTIVLVGGHEKLIDVIGIGRTGGDKSRQPVLVAYEGDTSLVLYDREAHRTHRGSIASSRACILFPLPLPVWALSLPRLLEQFCVTVVATARYAATADRCPYGTSRFMEMRAR